MRVFKIRLAEQGARSAWVVYDNVPAVLEEVEMHLTEDPTDGSGVIVTCHEMTEEEFKNLPEFEGW